MYFLGIDGGGSATRAVLIDAAREVVGRGVSGPSNHYAVGPAMAAQNCASAIALAISDARRLYPDLSMETIATYGFGLAGVRREADADLMRGFLSEICPRPFLLETDIVAAHAGAFSGKPGVVVSAGTGAVLLGTDEFGEKVYADGWGPILGDEGGGYWIGVEALRAVCRALDGRAPNTRFIAPVLDAMGVADGDALVHFVYSSDCTREKIASLAKVVFELADEGVSEAAEIRLGAARALSQGIKSVTRALLIARQERAQVTGTEIPALDLLIALRGGVFEDDFLRATIGYSVTEAMVTLKRDFFPLGSWRVVKPQHDAAVGAAILGQMRE